MWFGVLVVVVLVELLVVPVELRSPALLDYFEILVSVRAALARRLKVGTIFL